MPELGKGLERRGTIPTAIRKAGQRMGRKARDTTNSTMRQILVPLDDSELAAVVLPYVASIAERFHSKCLLYHVRETRPRWREGTLPIQIGGTTARTIREYLETVARRLSEQGIEVDTLIEPGNPAAKILQTARSTNTDLLVIATHGHGGIGLWLFGSVAHRVVERVDTPLLLVRPTSHIPTTGSIEFRHLLLPVDGGKEGEAPLCWAIEFARRYRATLHLLHVTPTLESLHTDSMTAAAISPSLAGEILGAATEAAETYLQELSETIREKNISVEFEVRRGEPAEEILRSSHETAIDLIFMATHGRLGFGGAWYGSVVNKILPRFSTPLILVRAPGTHQE